MPEKPKGGLDFKYTTPKEAKQGRHDGETIEGATTHKFKDTNLDVVTQEVRKLMASYGAEHNFELTLAFKK